MDGETSSEEEDSESGGFAEMAASASGSAETSEWSGCDAPCLPPEGNSVHRRRVQKNSSTGKVSALTGSDASKVCTEADGLEECKDMFIGVDCSDVVPTYRDAASLQNCVDKCRNAEAKCKTQSAQDVLKTPFKRCLVSALSDSGFFLTCSSASNL
ncbi:uncharacterized protein EMH_0093950 [Eimeria mitis]|uniref:Uncharacterized protein n=1 Tax=Eimeria mitis TaxID=44415 RepID=U6KF85_9EIME|nr:uncharacterized protein EMH_0093950 [Eimeria mitis]CDJ36700.1 hypothetical protein EMH_0093950 [Eimeria mitis]